MQRMGRRNDADEQRKMLLAVAQNNPSLTRLELGEFSIDLALRCACLVSQLAFPCVSVLLSQTGRCRSWVCSAAAALSCSWLPRAAALAASCTLVRVRVVCVLSLWCCGS